MNVCYVCMHVCVYLLTSVSGCVYSIDHIFFYFFLPMLTSRYKKAHWVVKLEFEKQL